MTFDAAGRPIAGTATSIEIDVGNDGSSDLVVTGDRAASASRRRPSTTAPRASGAFLDGNDVILGPELAQGAPLYGSFIASATASRRGPGPPPAASTSSTSATAAPPSAAT